MPTKVCSPIFELWLAPQVAIAGSRGIVSIGARAVAGAAEEVFGRKASVSRKKGGAEREECGDEEWALHGKRLLRHISNELGDICNVGVCEREGMAVLAVWSV